MNLMPNMYVQRPNVGILLNDLDTKLSLIDLDSTDFDDVLREVDLDSREIDRLIREIDNPVFFPDDDIFDF